MRAARGRHQERRRRRRRRRSPQAVSPRALWLDELELYVEVAQEKWPFPQGFTYRLMKDVGSEVYGKDLVGEEWGERYLKDHGAWNVMLFRQMLMTPLRTRDAMFLKERREFY